MVAWPSIWLFAGRFPVRFHLVPFRNMISGAVACELAVLDVYWGGSHMGNPMCSRRQVALPKSASFTETTSTGPSMLWLGAE